MSNISRRDFLKTAGVMTLAVAAAGVLAGCNTANVPAPEAGKPEVTGNSVSYTGLYGDKVTVESVGRYKVHATADSKPVTDTQTVLKVTYTKPNVNQSSSIESLEFALENGNTATDATSVNAKVAAKADFNAKNDVVKMANISTAIFNNVTAYEVEKYIVLDTAAANSNDLKVLISYRPSEGQDAKILTVPLAVTAYDIA